MQDEVAQICPPVKTIGGRLLRARGGLGSRDAGLFLQKRDLEEGARAAQSCTFESPHLEYYSVMKRNKVYTCYMDEPRRYYAK